MTDGSSGRREEPQRLAAALRAGLDPVADPMFDRFAAMVRTVLGVPVAFVSLDHGDRRDTPLIVSDARTDPGVRAYAAMPVRDADGRALGSLCAIDHEPRQWSEQEISLLADLAAACSDSLQLRIAVRAEADRSALLLRASAALGAAATSSDVVDTVRDLVIGSLDPAYVGVSWLGADGDIQLASGRLLPAHVASRWATYGGDVRTPSGLAARTGRTVILPDLAAVTSQTPDAVATFHEMGWQAAVSVPLPGLRGPIGALTFCWKQQYSPGEGEQAVLIALAGYVAQALQRASAYDDRRTAAETMQKALLTPLPELDHVRLAARYAPANRADLVGGDWYDAVRIDETRMAVVIGDVAGHGVTSAAAMGHYRSMLRALLVDRYDYPSALLARFERATRVLGIDDMATVLVAYLTADPDGGHTLTWANAGHLPPTLVLPDGTVTQFPLGGPLLGALRGVTRRTHTRRLPAGSRLLLYTDGLIETRGCPIDDGIECLHRVLTENPGVGLDDLADRMMEIIPAGEREDDASLLLIETLGLFE
ncbi:SpoIIE family protein phosphatase [Actinoplanes sp. NPDC051861]|uniref:SpoIIE family protein phosphatase n=1 Tax=Actinoplanes sp. NPDC051861 TaxID=3155170 RepID=UPI0034350516